MIPNLAPIAPNGIIFLGLSAGLVLLAWSKWRRQSVHQDLAFRRSGKERRFASDPVPDINAAGLALKAHFGHRAAHLAHCRQR